MKHWIEFPTLDRAELDEAAQMLIKYPLLTDVGFTLRIGFHGLTVICERVSTFLACRIMLRHWGFIN